MVTPSLMLLSAAFLHRSLEANGLEALDGDLGSGFCSVPWRRSQLLTQASLPPQRQEVVQGEGIRLSGSPNVAPTLCVSQPRP